MEIIKLSPAHADNRGSITDIITDEEINAITSITFTKGAIRANHYHEHTIQWNYVLYGEILLVTQFPDDEKKSVVLKKGDLALTREYERHALQALSDSEVLVLTRGPRAGGNYELDTIRLDVPLIISNS